MEDHPLMDIAFRCPLCQTGLSIDASCAGQEVRCPKCREVIRVPDHRTAAPKSPAKGSSPPAGALDLGLEIPDLEKMQSAGRGANLLRLEKLVYALTLVMAGVVAWLRLQQIFFLVQGVTAQEFWIRVSGDPTYALFLFFNTMTVLIGLYVVIGCVAGVRQDTSARHVVSNGLTYYLAVRVLTVVLVTYMAYRDGKFLPLRTSEVSWLVSSLIVCGAVIYFLSKLPLLRQGRSFALSESDGIEMVQSLMAKAAHARASDLHLEPTPEGGAVRFRVDGYLYPVIVFPTNIAERIVSRVKIMAQMDIAERRLPQDGQASFMFNNKEIDLRISTVPSAHGERLVVRFLDSEHGLIGLDQLGMPPDSQKRLEKILKSPHGVFFCTGPTGAGKSTTLYAALMSMNKSERNVITVEDPIEFRIPGITQLPVARKKGMTFASGLRSILRQDPDVIMVGEVRDAETAHMCIQASQTGHLVLSTLHTNDAPGAIARMLDLGSEPFLLASSLRAVMAQRLVRRVCPACSAPYDPTPEELSDLGLPADTQGDFRKGSGCSKCLSTGYYGRVGLFELLVVDDTIRKMINDRADAFTIRDAAIAAGMVTLRGDGVEKARVGVTTLAEIFRATASDVA